MASLEQLLDLAGSMDIYLLDQLMKFRFPEGIRILDAGCGPGRNLHFFLQANYEVYGTDISGEAIEQMRKKAAESGHKSADNFRKEAVEKMSFADGYFDAVISNAVLHFAKDEQHFKSMLDEMWRVLKPGGTFFCRLASSIGIEKRIQPLEGRHYLLPDGTKRFLVDETMLLRHTHRLGAHFLEPVKTVNVQNSRCMTTWVLQKS